MLQNASTRDPEFRIGFRNLFSKLKINFYDNNLMTMPKFELRSNFVLQFSIYIHSVGLLTQLKAFMWQTCTPKSGKILRVGEALETAGMEFPHYFVCQIACTLHVSLSCLHATLLYIFPEISFQILTTAKNSLNFSLGEKPSKATIIYHRKGYARMVEICP